MTIDDDSAETPLLDDSEAPLLRERRDSSCDSSAAPPTRHASSAAECRRLLSLAIPISTSEALSFLSYIITTAQVGAIGAKQLSAITLARSTFHITGLSIVVGLSTGVGTLSGQAFGSRHFALAGTITQRAILINLIACVFIIGAWTQLEPLLRLLGQDPFLSQLAARYILAISPALVMEAIYFCLKQHLTSQGLVTPLTAVAAAQTMATPVANHVCINVLDLGMDGVATAYNAVTLMTLALVAVAVCVVDMRRPAPERTWPVWSRHSLAGWLQYLKVALPSLAMICADWWCFEAIILVAGMRKDAQVQLAATGILFSTHSLVFMVNEGFGGAAQTRVANLLGSGLGMLARHSVHICLLLGSVVAVMCAAALASAAQPWVSLFTSDPAVLATATDALPWMAASVLGDGCNCVFTGTLTGAGRQGLGFAANLITYWGVGLPLVSLLAGRQGVKGMWMAMAAVATLQAVVLGIAVGCFDWSAEADDARKRVLEGADSLRHRSHEAPFSSGVCEPAPSPRSVAWTGHHGAHDALIASHEGAS